MNIAWISLHTGGTAGLVAVHLVGGVALGLVYFRTLWWSARRLAAGATIGRVLALMLARFAVLAGVLGWLSFAGALPLLAAALGVLLGRFIVVRRVRAGAP